MSYLAVQVAEDSEVDGAFGVYGGAAKMWADKSPEVMLSGPAECVHGDTVLEGTGLTIKECAERQIRPVVQTLDGPRLATVPFRKGRAMLYRVKTSGGEVLATGGHWVLTPSGFLPVDVLRPGQSVLEYSSFPSPKSSASCRSIRGLNSQHAVSQNTIHSIEPVGVDEFYDLHVPGAEHYFAGGLIHHNTGKTRPCLEKMDGLAITYPGMRALMCRRTYKSIKDSAVITFENKVLGAYDEDRGEFDPTQTPIKKYGGENVQHYDYPNGSRIVVGGLDRSDKVLSAEYDFIFVNQAEEISLADWETLITRATGRAGNMPYAQVLGDCNPAYPSHWILKRSTNGPLTRYVSRHEDNPTLFDPRTGQMTEQGRKTLHVLDNLTGARYLRLRKGLWVRAEGVVYEEWDERKHLLDRTSTANGLTGDPDDPIPDSWRRFRVVDFGYTNPFVCYDDQTEVLTQSGWKRFADLHKGEAVGTVNPETKEMEYQAPTAYIDQAYQGEMVTCEPDQQGADFCVTPNHRMVVETKARNWHKHRADQMPKHGFLPVGGWKPTKGKKVDPAFACLVGLFIAEGSFHYNGRSSYSIRIAQKDYVEEVRQVILESGYSHSEYEGQNGVVQFTISGRDIYEHFSRLVGLHTSHEKRLPTECFKWSTEAIQALLEGLILGDGRKTTHNENGHVIATPAIFTVSKKLADDIQAVCARVGQATRITSQTASDNYRGEELTLYAVRMNAHNRSYIYKQPIRRTQYDGRVYCLTVPNGTLIVRRNGRPMVSGNCQWWALDPDDRLYLYREIYMTGRTVRAHASDINELTEHRQETTVCDHDAEDRATLEENGIPCEPAYKAVTRGIDNVKERLKEAGDGKPRLYILRDSLVERDQDLDEQMKPTSTPEEIPGYIWKDSKGKDRPVKENDHGCDCMRYAAAYADDLGEARTFRVTRLN